MATVPRYRQTFFRLLGFLRPYTVSLVVSTLLAVVYQACQIAMIWVTGKGVIDNAIQPHDAHKLWIYTGIIVGLGILRPAPWYARGWISGRRRLWVGMASGR